MGGGVASFYTQVVYARYFLIHCKNIQFSAVAEAKLNVLIFYFFTLWAWNILHVLKLPGIEFPKTGMNMTRKLPKEDHYALYRVKFFWHTLYVLHVVTMCF